MQTEQVRKSYTQQYYAQARIDKFRRQELRGGRTGQKLNQSRRLTGALAEGITQLVQSQNEVGGLQYFDNLLEEEYFLSPKEEN